MMPWRFVCVALIGLGMGCVVTPQRRAERYVAQKEYRKALKVYVEMLNPQIKNGMRVINYHPETLTNIAVVYLEMGQYQKATDFLQLVIDRSPSYSKALFCLGVVYEKWGRGETGRMTGKKTVISDHV